MTDQLTPTLSATPGPAIDRRLGPARWRGAAGLVATGVCAWFSGRLVLEGVDLGMERSTVTALIGPSGCGKSTFLRILNRMHELVPGAQLAGSVELDGTDIYGRRLRATDTRRHIGMVFQKPNPFPAMSIYDNVLSGLKFSRMSMGDSDAVVEESLTKAGLWNEVKNRLRRARRRPVGWPAAAAVHRPGPGRRAPGAAHGRALLGARPHLDRAASSRPSPRSPTT